MGRKKTDTEKISLYLRTGDTKKVSEIFGGKPYGIYIRQLVSRFVDQYYNPPEVQAEGGIDLDPPERSEA